MFASILRPLVRQHREKLDCDRTSVLHHVLARVGSEVREWRRRSRDRRALAAMTERSPRHIGLTRYDAAFEASMFCKPMLRGGAMMNPIYGETPPVLQRDDRGGVTILTLNRPAKLNALSNDLLAAIMGALDDIEIDPAVRVIVFTGAGRAFSAGADIAGFQRYLESAHIALAADTATFSKAEINIGIMPTFGGTQRLPRNIGRKAAVELILTGRTFDATEAARLGLINRVVSSANLLDEALALANLLASKPSLTLAAALGAIHRGMDLAIDDGLAVEEAAFARIVPTHDAREGVAAFLEKRAPRFVGR
jgi:enoyl-CoA hydratase